MKYRSTVVDAGKSSTGLLVDDGLVAQLGGSKQPNVMVTLSGHTFRSTVILRGVGLVIPLSPEHRESAGVSLGDEVDLVVVLDDDPKRVKLPDDFATALDEVPMARERFDLMSYANQLGHVQLIDGAKNPEARVRRINKALDTLCEGF